MLDMRFGAPFIVQTRLLWMAYRRWQNPELRRLYNEANEAARLTSLPSATRGRQPAAYPNHRN
jgi:hypothetical protein